MMLFRKICYLEPFFNGLSFVVDKSGEVARWGLRNIFGLESRR
jgi:hypothetical protein